MTEPSRADAPGEAGTASRPATAQPRAPAERVATVMNHPAIAWCVLVVALAMTAAGWQATSSAMMARAETRFEFESGEVGAAIARRMAQYEQILRGGVGLFTAAGWMTRSQWGMYMRSLQLEERLPGVLGIGVAVRVEPEDMESFIAGVRAEGLADFDLQPAGKRPVYFPIIYLEPFEGRNLRALGYDMYAEPVRRRAMELAAETGQPAATGAVMLVQETGVDVQRGFLMYLPIYDGGFTPDTVEGRRERLVGYVYSPFRIRDLMHGISGTRFRRVRFEIFDGSAISEETFFYSSDSRTHLSGATDATFSRTAALQLPGREWSLYFEAGEDYYTAAEQAQPAVVVAGGVIVSLALFMVLTSMSRAGRRAQALATSMAAELETREALLRERSLALESESRFRVLADSVPVLIWMTDAQQQCIYFNKRWLDYAGRSINEELGDGWMKRVHPDDSETCLGERRGAMDSRKSFVFKYRIQRHDGEYRWLQDHGEPRFDALDRFAGYIGSCVDVTDDMRKDQALRESEERFRLLVEQSPEVISVVVDGKIEFINPAGAKVYGARSVDDLIGMRAMDLIHPDSLPFIAERNRRLAQGLSNPPAELKMQCLDGRIAYVESTAVPFTYKGRPAWQGVSRDITARKRAEEGLRRANETLEARVAERTAELREAKERAEAADAAKSMFLAAMSHELRTPLNAILGFSGTLLMKLPGPLNSEQERQLRTVQRNARHLLSLINDLLDLVKIESGKVVLEPEPVNCGEVLDDIAAALQLAVDEKKLQLIVERPPEDIVVRTDRRSVSQILLNLANNAVKFTESGSVRLLLEHVKDAGPPMIQFSVIDTGIGIAPAHQTRLFEAFSQVASESRRRGEGTGLGLHLSRRLAALLGGSITFTSEPGKGSRFNLVLPAELDHDTTS